MWNTPSQRQLTKIPKLYETEQIALPDKLLHLHFFLGGCDCYVAEYDGEDIFFGYAVLNGDIGNAEWGYFSFTELKSIKLGFAEVDCDRYWKAVPAREIPLIRCW